MVLVKQFNLLNNLDREVFMNYEQFEGKWEQLQGKIQQQWGKLTNDDLHLIKGKRKELIGKITERQGIAKEQAEKEVDDFIDKL